MATPRQVYIDSCVFISYLKNEATAQQCEGLFDSAEKGNITLVTSSLTLTEVIKVKSNIIIPQADQEKLKKFFLNKYILIANFERKIAENARDLIWQYSHLNPKDAGHLATALHLNVPTLYSFDEHFLKLNGKIPNMEIKTPDIPSQTRLDFAKA